MFDLASKYSFSLDKDSEKSLRCFLLLDNLERYVNGAIIEMRRLDRVRRSEKKEISELLKSQTSKKRKSFNLTYLALDTHFYFICIDKVYKLLRGMADELDDPDIRLLVGGLKKVFKIKKVGKRKINVRDDLEHIDERCLGFLSKKDKDKGIKVNIFDFGNFIGDSFSFNEMQFPSNKESLNSLKGIYSDLIEILTRKYASKNSFFVWRQQSEERYKQIMQRLKKAGLFNANPY